MCVYGVFVLESMPEGRMGGGGRNKKTVMAARK